MDAGFGAGLAPGVAGDDGPAAADAEAVAGGVLARGVMPAPASGIRDSGEPGAVDGVVDGAVDGTMGAAAGGGAATGW